MTIKPCIAAAAIGGFLAASQLHSQQISLGTRTGALTEPLSEIMGLAELRDGRVMLTDRVERALILGDFRTGVRKTLGRNGAGPTDYGTPFGPINWRGDTLLVYDPNNHRYGKVLMDGTIVGTIAFASHRTEGFTGYSTPRGVDTNGRIYWDGPVIQMQPVVQRLMQARIGRWLPGADSAEVVGEFTDHSQAEHRFRYSAFRQTDAWVVSPDGRIGVLSAADYRLRWYADGKLVETGPVIPYTPVKVTDAERAAFHEQKANEFTSGAAPAGQTFTPTKVGLERAKASWPDSLFPAVLPPFELQGALRAPNGTIWVKRMVAATDKSARVDVLDAHGALRGYIMLPPRSRLLAVGAASVYIIATDEDGLQTLERYAIPPQLK